MYSPGKDNNRKNILYKTPPFLFDIKILSKFN